MWAIVYMNNDGEIVLISSKIYACIETAQIVCDSYGEDCYYVTQLKLR